jgi:hypothetical protein
MNDFIRYVYQNRLGQLAVICAWIGHVHAEIEWDFGGEYEDDQWSYVCEL